jgi:hypothetical protein
VHSSDGDSAAEASDGNLTQFHGGSLEESTVANCSDLSPLAATLNKKSDGVNAVIAQFNSRLLALNLGIEVWVCVKDSGVYLAGDYEADSTQQRREFIGYAPCGNDSAWQLATRTNVTTWISKDAEPFSDGPEGATPLLAASRARRILAMQHMDALLAQMKQEAERLIRSIDNAAVAAEKL